MCCLYIHIKTKDQEEKFCIQATHGKICKAHKKTSQGHLFVLGVAGVSILTSYTEKPPVKKLPIFSEFIKNSAKFIKKSGLTKWTLNLR